MPFSSARLHPDGQPPEFPVVTAAAEAAVMHSTPDAATEFSQFCVMLASHEVKCVFTSGSEEHPLNIPAREPSPEALYSVVAIISGAAERLEQPLNMV